MLHHIKGIILLFLKCFKKFGAGVWFNCSMLYYIQDNSCGNWRLFASHSGPRGVTYLILAHRHLEYIISLYFLFSELALDERHTVKRHNIPSLVFLIST